MMLWLGAGTYLFTVYCDYFRYQETVDAHQTQTRNMLRAELEEQQRLNLERAQCQYNTQLDKLRSVKKLALPVNSCVARVNFPTTSRKWIKS